MTLLSISMCQVQLTLMNYIGDIHLRCHVIQVFHTPFHLLNKYSGGFLWGKMFLFLALPVMFVPAAKPLMNLQLVYYASCLCLPIPKLVCLFFQKPYSLSPFLSCPQLHKQLTCCFSIFPDSMQFHKIYFYIGSTVLFPGL